MSESLLAGDEGCGVSVGDCEVKTLGVHTTVVVVSLGAGKVWVVVKVRDAGAVVRIEEAENYPGEASALLDSSIGIKAVIPQGTGTRGW